MSFSYYSPETPRINVGIQDAESLARQCWAALQPDYTKTPRLYRQGNKAVRVAENAIGQAVVEPLSIGGITYEISQRAELLKVKADGSERPSFLPPEVARHMYESSDPDLPKLTAVAQAPVFTSDRRLILTPGYDPESGILYHLRDGSPLADLALPEITPERVRKAVSLWMDCVLADFPFVAPAHKAHAMAVAILPFVRQLISGHTPLHACSKWRPGEGASLLMTVLMCPTLGYSAPRMPPPADESEWRRALMAWLRQQSQAILIDNARVLKSACLASMITSSTTSDRIVGTSNAVAVPVNCIWLATGINIEMSDEIARRTVPILLDSDSEFPSRREGFKIPDLENWVKANRPRLVKALLVIVQSWINAGCPESRQKMGGFDRYAAVIGGILEHAGIVGFLDVLADTANDVGGLPAETFDFFEAVARKYESRSFSANDVLELAKEVRLVQSSGTATDLGRLLGRATGRRFDRREIERAGKVHNTQRWRIVER